MPRPNARLSAQRNKRLDGTAGRCLELGDGMPNQPKHANYCYTTNHVVDITLWARTSNFTIIGCLCTRCCPAQ